MEGMAHSGPASRSPSPVVRSAAATLRERPSHQLEPAESQGVIAFLQDSLERFELLGALNNTKNDNLASQAEISEMVGEEISRVFAEQQALQRRYEELLKQRIQLRQLPGKSKVKHLEDAIKRLGLELRTLTNVLSRNFDGGPNLGEKLSKIQEERLFIQELLVKTIDELMDKNTFDSLVSIVEQTKQQDEEMKQIVDRDLFAMEQVERLRKEIAEEKEELERDRTSSAETITRLKNELRAAQIETTVDLEYKKKEGASHVNTQRRVFQNQKDDKADEISKVQTQLEVELRVNKETVDFLERRHEELQNEIQSWMTKYDQDIEAMDSLLETEKNNVETDSERLKETRKIFSTLTEETRLLNSERVEREKEVRQVNAATVIQRRVRRWLAQPKPKKVKGKPGTARGKRRLSAKGSATIATAGLSGLGSGAGGGSGSRPATSRKSARDTSAPSSARGGAAPGTAAASAAALRGASATNSERPASNGRVLTPKTASGKTTT